MISSPVLKRFCGQLARMLRLRILDEFFKNVNCGDVEYWAGINT